MNVALIKNGNMNASIDTGWKQLHSGKERPSLYSIQTEWKSVTGTLDGTISIYKSNSYEATKTATLMKQYTVSSASNATDCEDLVINSPIEFVKVVYTKNNISAGTLNVILSAEIDDAD